MSPAYFPNSPAAIAAAAFAIIIPSYWVLSRRQTQGQTPATTAPTVKKNPFAVGDRQLQPPKDDPYTLAEVRYSLMYYNLWALTLRNTQLAAFDGRDPNQPVYVAIKGLNSLHSPRAWTLKRDVYGPGGSYSVFAGKDGSKGLGLSSLKLEDAVPDWSTLEVKERGVLNDWYAFYSKIEQYTRSLSQL
ncbi:hypothetical protein FRC07_015171 [Ceratobasidium sp. 392]|nr:hypothetical protein FRC07_015171 [Ceratobasidium sp. 392]